MTTALHKSSQTASAKPKTTRKPSRTTKTLPKEKPLEIDRDSKPAWLPTALKVVTIEPLHLSSQELITCLEKDKQGVTVASLSSFRNKLWLTPSDLTKLIARLSELNKQMQTKIAHLQERHVVYVIGRGTFSEAEIMDGAIEEVLNHRGDYYETLAEAQDARDLLPAEPKQYVYKVLVKKGVIVKMIHAEPERTPKPERKTTKPATNKPVSTKTAGKQVLSAKKPVKRLLS